MKIALRVLAVLFAILLLIVAVGFALPVKHRAVREARYNRPPPEIFALITDVKNFPTGVQVRVAFHHGPFSHDRPLPGRFVETIGSLVKKFTSA